MKKNILISAAVIITLSLTAFGVVNKNTTATKTLDTHQLTALAVNTTDIKKAEPLVFTDFTFDIGSRFEPIKKTDIDKATKLSDFIDAETVNNIVDLESVNIIVILNEAQSNIREMGYDKQLTAAQIKLLRGLDYETGFTIRAEFTALNEETGKIEHRFRGPHLTIVPEQEAKYLDGNDAIIKYIKTNSKKTVDDAKVDIEKTRPVKFHFTVTKEGTIGDVRLDYSTNYPTIDNKMIELLKSLPNQWIPAKNSKGEIVEQVLVLTLGIKGMGC